MSAAAPTRVVELERMVAELRSMLAARESAHEERAVHQAATNDVLKAMSASPGDPQPVFDAIVAQAVALCGGPIAGLFEFDGAMIHCRAAIFHGRPPEVAAAYIASFPRPADQEPNLALAISIREARIVHIRDAETSLDISAAAVRAGLRSGIIVPLLRDGRAIGAMSLSSKEAGGYSDSQVELLTTFAEQASIAITSAETYRALQTRTANLREALAQQTATAEVLGVINASPGDLTPVFEAILEKAHALCGAEIGTLTRYDGEFMRALAVRGLPAEQASFVTQPFRPSLGGGIQRLIDGARFSQMADMATEHVPGHSETFAMRTSLRTYLGIPLRKDGAFIGQISAYRREVRPFAENEIALLENFAAQAVIAMENARLLTEQREALERQTATADILHVINENPGDLTPIFDAVLEKGLRLIDAAFGGLWLYEGDMMRSAATRGMTPALAEFRARNPVLPISGAAREASETQHTIQILDLKEGQAYRSGRPATRAVADLGGARTMLVVPLLKDNRGIGAIQVYRQEVRAFTAQQIALLENFAAQAVIAIENARLLTEQREALERQTATAEVLEVINASPGDLAPVFDTILEKALRICESAFGSLHVYDGEHFRGMATRGMPPALHDISVAPMRPAPGMGMHRIVAGEDVVHFLDARDDDGYRSGNRFRVALVDIAGARTQLQVALRKDGRLLGVINVYRQEVKPYSDKQIALLENFAAQAVIAMENARLLTEQREALEQQTAMAEVLRVINANPGDVLPAFDAMLEKALRLCDAAFGGLYIFDGDGFRPGATRGMPPEIVAIPSIRATPGMTLYPITQGEPVVHTLDLADDDIYRSGGSPTRTALVDLAGARTQLQVALRAGEVLLGVIMIYRRRVMPFTERQIALLRNFADQAVIAIENARLLTEQREALERQTATAEVLQAINANPGNLLPVFDAMLEKAALLCDAQCGSFFMIDGDTVQAVVTRGLPAEYHAEIARKGAVGPLSGVARVAGGEDVVHLPDMRLGRSYLAGEPFTVRTVDVFGMRTWLGVPLRKDGVALGLLAVARFEVRPFTDRQIDLLKSFAAQAVIAMDNARLLTEQREALERQTATAEVLGVINENPGNLAPVFDTILEKALTLSEAAFGTLWTFDTENAAGRIAATRNIPPALAEFRATHPPTGPSPLLSRVLGERRSIHQLDIRDDESYRSGHPSPRSVVELGGARTLLLVPLLKDRTILGTFQIYRRDVRAFTDRQISLVENFAAQAVIAMDNARLLREQREALERQTAMAEVLRVINTNPGNLRPVFDVILAKAHAVCGADMGGLFLWNDTHYWLEASLNNSAAYEALFSLPRPLEAGFLIKRLTEEPYVHIPDCQAIMADINRAFGPEIAERAPRTSLSVALRGDGVTIGHITANRLRKRPYTGAEISLLENFAAQAVIAMDNARLLNEIRQRQSELDITFENMGDGVAMFDREQKLAAWNRNFQDILDLPDDAVRVGLPFDDYIRGLAAKGEYGPGASADEQLARLTALLGQANRFERTRPTGRVIDIRQNPIPDGGFVIIYADITERKRAEEALRAARDDAETALRELKVAQASLVQAEKMASLGQLTAGIAHEIKNPLNFVNNFAALSVELLDELKEVTAPALATLNDDARADADDLTGTLTSNLHKIEEHGKRADNIVRGMLEHSRGSTGERRAVELNELVEEALNLAYHGARARDQSFNITLERDYGAGIAPIEVAPQDLTRVFLNLYGNGFDAARTRQKTAPAGFEPKLRVSTRDHGDSVEIRVRDNGTGVPPELRDKLFQPFFTTKPTGEGTGLGLSISYDIVTQQHGGSIVLDSELNAFTEFTVTIPRGMASG